MILTATNCNRVQPVVCMHCLQVLRWVPSFNTLASHGICFPCRRQHWGL